MKRVLGRTAFGIVASAALAAVVASVVAPDADEPAKSPTSMPASVKQTVNPSQALAGLLNGKDEKGNPALDSDELAYFKSLPGSAVELFNSAVADENITSSRHLAELLKVRMTPDRLDVVLTDNCFMCHTDPESQTEEDLFSMDPKAAGSPPFMSLASLTQDVHMQHGLSCAGCHGGDPSDVMDHDYPPIWPDDADARTRDRSWVPVFCGKCHADVNLVGHFNSDLPTDQLAKYELGVHGKALLKDKDNRSAECVSCHGVHGILGKNDPRSPVYAKNVPATCASCHADARKMQGYRLDDGSPLPTNQFERYRTSVHGKALLERGDTGSPACDDCHGNHATKIPPQRVCEECHAGDGKLFAGSKHKKAFADHGWAECSKCHGYHAIGKTNDEMLAVTKGALCRDCHDEYSKDNPACVATADFFHGSILYLAQGESRVKAEAEQFARQGLDVEPLEDRLGQLGDLLRQLRSQVHTFDADRFMKVGGPADKVLDQLDADAARARREYRRRRLGLYAAMVVIIVLMALLWLKLRSVE